jgi:hypothetical protein
MKLSLPTVMQFTLLSSTFVAILAAVSSVSATPVAREILDVWAPTIISPNASTIWTKGQQYNVTWSTSNAPVNISNGAAVEMGHDGTILTDQVLAKGFDLRQGWVTVTCPSDLPAGANYSIILFGDSGDQSQQFSLVDETLLNVLGL